MNLAPEATRLRFAPRHAVALVVAGWGLVCLAFGLLNGVHALSYMSQHWPAEILMHGRWPGWSDLGVRGLLAAFGCLAMGAAWLLAARYASRPDWRKALWAAGAGVAITLLTSLTLG